MSKKIFILYDGRARFGNTDTAWVLDTAESEDEIRDMNHTLYPEDAIWAEYDLVGKKMTNENLRWDLLPIKNGEG